MTAKRILYLLQLASPALPVGAYSYSEGIEALVDAGTISNESSLQHWLAQELHYGAVRLEAAVMIRAYRAMASENVEALSYWNEWLSAARETEELRLSSWQMGRSLVKLLLQCFPQVSPFVDTLEPCNYAIAFGIAAAFWNIEPLASVLGYLHSWTTNLVTAGVKLVPLGQTAGQRVMLSLFAELDAAATEIMALDDDDLNSCGWGLTLASMAHETQYTRLFRS